MDVVGYETDAERTGPIPVITAPTRAPRRWRRRFAALGLVVLLVAAACAGGVWLGWRWAVDRDVAVADTAAAPAATADDVTRVPDVRGLAIADAKQALADSGTDPAAITVVEVAAALAPGTVVAQDPVGGETVTGHTELKVAKEAVMPAAAGHDERAVVDELSAFGARVRVEQRYVPSAKTGTVVETRPAPGQPVPLDVTVVVAAPPSSVYVDEVALLSGGCSAGELKINGGAHRHGLTCSVGREATIEVLLDRGVTRIAGVVGIPDTGEQADAVTLVVAGDGRELARVEPRYGADSPIDLDTTGVLRLTMTVTASSGEDTSPAIAFGDVVLYGAPATIAGLDR
jgi:NPCBM/NEW2 domain-containing protein/PASTA domain-containing protein